MQEVLGTDCSKSTRADFTQSWYEPVDKSELESNMPTFKHGEKPESRFPSLLLPGELALQESIEQLFYTSPGGRR